MARCTVCGEHDGLNNTCNYCGLKHCKSHILPENHDCAALQTGSNRTQSSQSSSATTSEDRESKYSTSASSRDTDVSPSRGGDDSPPVQTKDQSSSRSALTDRIRRAGRIISTILTFVLGVVILGLSFVFSKRGLALTLVLVAGLGLYSGFVDDTGIGIVDDSVDSAVETVSPVLTEAFESSSDPSQSADSTASEQSDRGERELVASGGDTNAAGSLDEERTTELIHQRINEIRAERGLSPLNHDGALAEVADYHSQDMLEDGYFAHDSPDGEEMSDRYERFGYDCRVATGGNRYMTGAENIFRLSGTTSSTEESVAEQTVAGWMNSPEHRENILQDYWRNEGVGIAAGRANGEMHVYVTQNFC